MSELVIKIKCLNCNKTYDYPETASNGHSCPFCGISHEDHYNCKDVSAKEWSKARVALWFRWNNQKITLVLGDKELKGKVVKILPSGKLKIQTSEYEDWDIHPSLIKDNKVIIQKYQQRQVLNEFETHTKTIEAL